MSRRWLGLTVDIEPGDHSNHTCCNSSAEYTASPPSYLPVLIRFDAMEETFSTTAQQAFPSGRGHSKRRLLLYGITPNASERLFMSAEVRISLYRYEYADMLPHMIPKYDML